MLRPLSCFSILEQIQANNYYSMNELQAATVPLRGYLCLRTETVQVELVRAHPTI